MSAFLEAECSALALDVSFYYRVLLGTKLVLGLQDLFSVSFLLCHCCDFFLKLSWNGNLLCNCAVFFTFSSHSIWKPDLFLVAFHKVSPEHFPRMLWRSDCSVWPSCVWLSSLALWKPFFLKEQLFQLRNDLSLSSLTLAVWTACWDSCKSVWWGSAEEKLFSPKTRMVTTELIFLFMIFFSSIEAKCKLFYIIVIFFLPPQFNSYSAEVTLVLS